MTFSVFQRVHHLGGGPRVGCWGRFVQFGWEPDRSGRELDSFSGDRRLDEPPPAHVHPC